MNERLSCVAAPDRYQVHRWESNVKESDVVMSQDQHLIGGVYGRRCGGAIFVVLVLLVTTVAGGDGCGAERTPKERDCMRAAVLSATVALRPLATKATRIWVFVS